MRGLLHPPPSAVPGRRYRQHRKNREHWNQRHRQHRRRIQGHRRTHPDPSDSVRRIHAVTTAEQFQTVLRAWPRRRRLERVQGQRTHEHPVRGKNELRQHLVVPQLPRADPARDALHGRGRRNGRRIKRSDDPLAAVSLAGAMAGSARPFRLSGRTSMRFRLCPCHRLPWRPRTHKSIGVMDALFDQTALTDLADRLVAAARRAGADAADAIATRGISQSVEVRDGTVEESERSEGDDLGLRVFVGHKQAVVSTNDLSGANAGALAERAVAMARATPEDLFAGLAEPGLLAQVIPDLDMLDSKLPSVKALEDMARAAETA